MDLFGDLPPPASDNKAKTGTFGGFYDAKEDKKLEKRKNSDGEQDEVNNKRVKSEERDNKQNKCYEFSFKSYLTERKGEREDMQDATLLLDDCTKDLIEIQSKAIKIKKSAFIAVFDGHAGSKASHHAQESLFKNITNRFPKDAVDNFDRELKKSLIQAFKDTDETFIDKARKESPPWKDGSTATCFFQINNIVYAANIGDSKAILVRKVDGKNVIVPLTKDHSPTDYKERQRIQNAGGIVRDGRVQGVLEVSRAFGDARFKKFVISTPDVFKCSLTENDRYLIIACDGLWKAFTNQEAVNFVDRILEDNTIEMNSRFEKASKELANEAVRQFSGDNVSVILVNITSKLDQET